MAKVKIRQGDWVVVCDGKKALVLENVGDEKLLNLKTREVYEQPDLKTHELGTDAPGRAISSVGTARSIGGGGEGLDGVSIFNPSAKLIGHISLPERCANLCFGGLKRNRLFMAASQSLYALFVNTQGAPGG